MTFTEEDVKAMQADLAAVREHVHRLMLVGKIVASHRKSNRTVSEYKKSLQLGAEKFDLIGDMYERKDGAELEDECEQNVQDRGIRALRTR